MKHVIVTDMKRLHYIAPWTTFSNRFAYDREMVDWLDHAKVRYIIEDDDERRSPAIARSEHD